MGGQINHQNLVFHGPVLSGGELGPHFRHLGRGGDAVYPLEPGENSLKLLLGEHCLVYPVALRNGHAPIPALGGDKGNPRHADVLNVTVDGPPGDLEPLRQLRSGDFVPLEQEHDDADQPVDFHSASPRVHYTTKT